MYKVVKEFMIEKADISIIFNLNQKWEYLGTSNELVKLRKSNVFIKIPKEIFEERFKEVKE